MNERFEALGLKPFGAVPSERQLNHLRHYNKKAFFHFGINTFTDSEWGNGEENEKDFNPSETDVRQWIKAIKAAGFKLAILTAKHHDGFCLWQSSFTEHSLKNSPYKNGKGDIVREFTDACREMDIKCGIYLSPWDRNSPYWGTSEYSKSYNNQLTELLSNYGRIDEVWWDGAGSKETPYDWGMWAHTVRNLQPEAVIFGSLGATPYVECRWVGNESGYAGDPHYSTVSAYALEVENTPLLNSGEFGGERFIPAEVDVSIRPGWFYHDDQDEYVKSPEQLVKLWFNSIGRAAMMLLNFPPDRRGLLPDADILSAVKADKIIKETFAVNLAAAGKAKSNSTRALSCEADFLLNDSYDTFYAASDDNITPTVEIELPEAVEFDTFAIGEKIELGLRVRGYRIDALVNGEWKLLADKKSIGHLWAERFDRVRSNRIKISIYDAAAAPVLRTFGLYKLPDEYYEKQKTEADSIKNARDLTKLKTAKILEEEGGIKVEFGGIYPFNTVCFDGYGIWEYKIEAFDGAGWYTVYKGTKPDEHMVVKLDKTIDSSYQIRIITNHPENSERNVKVFEL